MTYDLEPPLPRTATPKDYHRVHFDPSALPDKRIVGLLACQRDPLLRALTTRILSANPAPISAPPPAKGRAKQKKPNGDASATASGSATPSGSDTPKLEVKGQLWEVELEDTIIFPEGGGQPFDTGRLVVEVEGAREEFVVEGCLRKKLESVHLVRVPEGKESVLQAAVGGMGEVTVDWERRMDHMALHTGQHLLSALLDVHAEGLPTLSWSMAPYPSLDLPYVELPRGLTWAEAEEIERKCNEAIYEATKVWVDVTMQEEGFVKETAAGVRENRGIPSDYKDGVIRHIIIQGIDKNACCGTQLPHLGHLGLLHVLPPSTPFSSTKPVQTPSRLYFVAGPRAVQYLQHSSRQLSLAAQAIAVNRGEIVPRVEKLDQGRKELLAREKTLRTELAQVIGENAAPDAQGAALVKRTEKSTHDFEFMGAISFAVKDAKVVVVVSAPAGVDPALVLVQSADADLAKRTNEGIKEGLVALAGGEKGKYKGGGAKGRYMGKVEGKWGKAEDEVVKRVLSGQSSGHKEATEDHATVAQMATMGENADPEALLQGRLLNNPNVGRAALYDETDFLCIASSTKQFDVEPDQVRKILDALLTYARQNDPTFAGGNGAPAEKLHLNEGTVDVKLGDQEKIAGDLNGKTFVAARTAKYVLFVEGTSDANDAALGTIVQSFQEGLQTLTL